MSFPVQWTPGQIIWLEHDQKVLNCGRCGRPIVRDMRVEADICDDCVDLEAREANVFGVCAG